MFIYSGSTVKSCNNLLTTLLETKPYLKQWSKYQTSVKTSLYGLCHSLLTMESTYHCNNICESREISAKFKQSQLQHDVNRQQVDCDISPVLIPTQARNI